MDLLQRALSLENEAARLPLPRMLTVRKTCSETMGLLHIQYAIDLKPPFLYFGSHQL